MIESTYDLEKKWELTGALATYVTVSATISTIPGRVNNISIMNSGSADGYMQLRNGGAEGTVVWRAFSGMTPVISDTAFYPGIRFGTNIYAELSNCTLSLSWTP